MSKNFNWAFSSQQTSIDNSGIVGIYHKTFNSTTSMARLQDVRGNWNCSYDGEAHTYELIDQDTSVLVNDLNGQNLLFNTSQALRVDSWANINRHHIFLSASWTNITQPKTSTIIPEICLAFSEHDDREHNLAYIRVMDCSLNAGSITHLVVRVIDMRPDRVLAEAVTFIASQLWNEINQTQPAVEPLQMSETWLNALTMTAGTAGSISRTLNNRPLSEREYGCIRTVADVPWTVITLFLLTVALLLFFSVYAFILLLRLQRFKRQVRSGMDSTHMTKLLKYTPNDLVGWMRHATAESDPVLASTSRPTKENDLRNWSLNAVSGGMGPWLRVSHKHDGSIHEEMKEYASSILRTRSALSPAAYAVMEQSEGSPVLEQKKEFVVERGIDEIDIAEHDDRKGLEERFLITRKPLSPRSTRYGEIGP